MTDATDATDRDTPGLVLEADEIVNYPLKKATRGYAVNDVDDLLDQFAVQTQDLLDQLARVSDERDQLRHEVSELRAGADRMRATAVARIEEMLVAAVKQAHEIREGSLRRARADEADVRRHRRDVEAHIEQLRTFAADHRARIARHLELQQERLAEMELPAPPPEPEFVRDDLLDEDAPTIDVEEFMAGLEEAAINDPAENLFES